MLRKRLLRKGHTEDRYLVFKKYWIGVFKNSVKGKTQYHVVVQKRKKGGFRTEFQGFYRTDKKARAVLGDFLNIKILKHARATVEYGDYFKSIFPNDKPPRGKK